MRGEHTDPADPSSLRARHQGAAQLLGKAGTTQNPGVAERLKRGPQDNGGGRGPGLGGGAAARAGVRLRPEQSLGRVHTTTADIHVAPMAWKCRLQPTTASTTLGTHAASPSVQTRLPESGLVWQPAAERV